jgi:hypothetical protein
MVQETSLRTVLLFVEVVPRTTNVHERGAASANDLFRSLEIFAIMLGNVSQSTYEWVGPYLRTVIDDAQVGPEPSAALSWDPGQAVRGMSFVPCLSR